MNSQGGPWTHHRTIKHGVGGGGHLSRCEELVRELDISRHWDSMPLLKWCITLLTWGNVHNIVLKNKNKFYSRMCSIFQLLQKVRIFCWCVHRKCGRMHTTVSMSVFSGSSIVTPPFCSPTQSQLSTNDIGHVRK